VKFTLSWLKEHLDTDASLDDIVTKLTMIGLEVEGVEDKGKQLAPYVIAKVIEAKQHPNTGCASAWSIPETASRSRSCAARRTRGPA
jgi:hypothetical protein